MGVVSWLLTGEDLLGWERLSVSDQGVLCSKMPVMAPSHGGLCSFCRICQWNWQLAVPTGNQERFFWSVVLLWIQFSGLTGPMLTVFLNGAHTLTLFFCRKLKVGKTQMTSNLGARCSVTVDLRFFFIRLEDEVLFQLVEHHQDRDFMGFSVGKHDHAHACTFIFSW